MKAKGVRARMHAETVICAIEDADEDTAFELTVTANFDAQSAIERKRVPRWARLSPSDDVTGAYVRLANLPTYPLDRLSRYEVTLWRQACQIAFALRYARRH